MNKVLERMQGFKESNNHCEGRYNIKCGNESEVKKVCNTFFDNWKSAACPGGEITNAYSKIKITFDNIEILADSFESFIDNVRSA